MEIESIPLFILKKIMEKGESNCWLRINSDSPIVRLPSGHYAVETNLDFKFFDKDGNRIKLVDVMNKDINDAVRLFKVIEKRKVK